jgi:hypothetical protein
VDSTPANNKSACRRAFFTAISDRMLKGEIRVKAVSYEYNGSELLKIIEVEKPKSKSNSCQNTRHDGYYG